MIDIIIPLTIFIIAGYLIAKNYDAKAILFIAGLSLLYCAVFAGKIILDEKESTGVIWLDPLKMVTLIFIKQLGNIGLTIMVLFGFSSYMTHIGANDVTVHLLTKPLKKIKSPYFLVPVIFLLGNLLSLVVPSASSLAVLLMATLYPVLKFSGMSTLTAGAVIATTATIMPTPLGADNVLAAEKLGIPLVEYVTYYHAPVSIPTLFLMAIAHYFWQKFMDKKQVVEDTGIDKDKLHIVQDLPPSYYGLFPVLPLLFVFVLGIFFKEIKIGIIEITFICLGIALCVELIRKGKVKETTKDLGIFFNGMGAGLAQVVSLIVAASLLVEGLKKQGTIDMIINSVENIENVGIFLTLIFTSATAIIGFISGSGLAVFYSFINIIPEITAGLNVNSVSVALPMQLTANLIRSASPVAAVIIIVAAITKSNPFDIVKRTSIPVIIGILSTLILSILLFS
ncbi:C4-dicarboxylate transporter DcuC [Thorsellia kenyensis]|uniref:C4-dicarboxylate transporter DcuC n=1 Tax=Thorsellia kenyensis TaxID=1549888 RepID=A0ABV6CC34_9GAMM